jgi:hypothetical protein
MFNIAELCINFKLENLLSLEIIIIIIFIIIILELLVM